MQGTPSAVSAQQGSNTNPASSTNQGDTCHFEGSARRVQKKKPPWYVTAAGQFFRTVAIILISSAAAAIAGTIGAVVAGSLSSMLLNLYGQRKNDHINWGWVAVDGLLGALPGVLGKGVVRAGRSLMGQNSQRAMEKVMENSTRLSMGETVIAKSVDGAVMGFAGSAINTSFQNHAHENEPKKTLKTDVRRGHAQPSEQQNRPSDTGLRAVLPTMLGAILGGATVAAITRGHSKSVNALLKPKSRTKVTPASRQKILSAMTDVRKQQLRRWGTAGFSLDSLSAIQHYAHNTKTRQIAELNEQGRREIDVGGRRVWSNEVVRVLMDRQKHFDQDINTHLEGDRQIIHHYETIANNSLLSELRAGTIDYKTYRGLYEIRDSLLNGDLSIHKASQHMDAIHAFKSSTQKNLRESILKKLDAGRTAYQALQKRKAQGGVLSADEAKSIRAYEALDSQYQQLSGTRENKAGNLIYKLAQRKAAYRRLKRQADNNHVMGKAETDAIKRFESRSDQIVQTLHVSPTHAGEQKAYSELRGRRPETLTKKEKDFMSRYQLRVLREAEQSRRQHYIGFDEHIVPGFRRTNGSKLIIDNDTVIVDIENDPALRANIAKIANLLNDSTHLSVQEQWLLVMRHIENTFHVRTKDAEDILRSLPTGTSNYFGTHIDYGLGICRHKSLLAKIIGDHVGLESSLNGGVQVDAKGKAEGHSWNRIRMDGKLWLLDIHNNRFEAWSPALEKEYIQGKTRLDYTPPST